MAAAPYAFVTLVSSDSYLPGALAVAGALKDVHPSPPVPPEVPFQTVCLVTPETVDVSTIKLLRGAFDTVIGVEIIGQADEKGLKLLGEFSPKLVCCLLGHNNASAKCLNQTVCSNLPMASWVVFKPSTGRVYTQKMVTDLAWIPPTIPNSSYSSCRLWILYWNSPTFQAVSISTPSLPSCIYFASPNSLR